jgi:hypothetical protein
MGKMIYIIFNIVIEFIFLGMRKEWILSEEEYVDFIVCLYLKNYLRINSAQVMCASHKRLTFTVP